MKRSILILVATLVPVASGCYSYKPIQSPQPGMEVRARLTGDAAARVSQGLDEPILRYDGRVVAAGPDSIELDVLVARMSSALQEITIRDTITLRRADVQAIQERRLSPGRSVVFGIALAAGAAAVVTGLDQLVGGSGEDDDGGTPNARPALSLPIQRLINWLTQYF